MESGEKPELTRSGMGDEPGNDHWDCNPGKALEEDEPEPEDTATHRRGTRPRERVMTEKVNTMFKPRSRSARAFAVVLALCMALLAGCSSGGDASGSAGGADGEKVLRFVTVYPPNTTDAHIVNAAFVLNSGAVESLVGIDPETLKPYPWLAESWQSDDAQHWTFAIRPGITFHNGNPLNAEAVRASLQHAIEVNPGVAAALKIQDVQAVDDSTLTITTESVYPALISNLIHQNAVIVDVTDPGDLPIGTGPFKFESFDPNTEAVLVRNTDYWDGQAKLDRIVMAANADANARMLAIQAGDADVIYRPSTESIEALSADPDITVESVPGNRVYHLMYNYSGQNAELWNNAEFRRGIDALMDRQAIVDGVMAGQGTVAFNPFPGDWPFSPTPMNHPSGTEAALKHFEAAGLDVKDGKVFKDGQPLTLKVVTYIARPELPLIAQLLRDSAAKVGITMDIQVADNIDEYVETHEFDIMTYSLLTITRGDGSFFLNGTFGQGGAQNHGHFENPTLTSMLDAYNSELDADARNEKAKQIASWLEAEAINSYLVVPNETSAYNNRVTGWQTPINEFEFPMMTKDLDID